MFHLFRELLSGEAHVLVAEMDPQNAPALSSLSPDEAKLAENAVPSRQREFAAGRYLAGDLLTQIGAPSPVLRNDDRSPIWPAGIVGSITHTKNYCAVAVAKSELIRGVGLDVEQLAPLKNTAVLAAIVANEDKAWLEKTKDQLAWGKLVFSAKECAYKAQYHLARTYLGFDAMWIEPKVDVTQPLPSEGTFVAHFRKPSGDFSPGDTLTGHFRTDSALGVIATSVVF